MKNNNQNKRLNTLNIIYKQKIENLFTSIVYGTYKQYKAATLTATTTTTTKSNSNKQTNSNEASNKKQ